MKQFFKVQLTGKTWPISVCHLKNRTENVDFLYYIFQDQKKQPAVVNESLVSEV